MRGVDIIYAGMYYQGNLGTAAYKLDEGFHKC